MYKGSISIVFISLMVLFLACGESQKKQNENILLLENELQNTYDTVKMAKLVRLYDKYVTEFLSDSLTPNYIFRSAEVNRVLGKGTEALTNYHLLISKYPESIYVPESYFFKAVVYEDVLYDFAAAAVCYREFIEKYPDHPFAKDAQFSLQYIGKSPEEIIMMHKGQQNGDTL